MPLLKETEQENLNFNKKRRSWKRIQFIVLNNKKHRIKKNSIGVSQRKILVDATISYQVKPWRYEEMKNSDEKVNIKAFRDVRKRYLGGDGLLNYT